MIKVAQTELEHSKRDLADQDQGLSSTVHAVIFHLRGTIVWDRLILKESTNG